MLRLRVCQIPTDTLSLRYRPCQTAKEVQRRTSVQLLIQIWVLELSCRLHFKTLEAGHGQEKFHYVLIVGQVDGEKGLELCNVFWILHPEILVTCDWLLAVGLFFSCGSLAFFQTWYGVWAPKLDSLIWEDELLDRLERVKVLLVLDHKVLDNVREGVKCNLSWLRVDVDLLLPLVKQRL